VLSLSFFASPPQVHKLAPPRPSATKAQLAASSKYGSTISLGTIRIAARRKPLPSQISTELNSQRNSLTVNSTQTRQTTSGQRAYQSTSFGRPILGTGRYWVSWSWSLYFIIVFLMLFLELREVILILISLQMRCEYVCSKLPQKNTIFGET
jgi:hypothetical protein